MLEKTHAFLLIAAFSLACTNGERNTAPPIGDGDGNDAPGVVRTQPSTPNPPLTLTLRSRTLGEERRVYVQLPEGYATSEARYPVVVVLDGEWLFELARAHVRFFSEYDVMDVNLPRMIVVGIENVDRDRDYVPTEDPKEEPDFPTAGHADEFLEFLDRELLPLLDRRYRTAPSRAIAGWSFGGLFAMYAAVAKPDLFDAYLCIGPAIWWDSDYVFEKYRTARFKNPKRMVITLGSYEKGGEVYTSTRRILDRFEREPVDGLSVSHLELDGVGHSWGIPAAFDKGLQKLFDGFLPPEEVSAGTPEEITAYYDGLSERWGFRVNPPAAVMQDLALREWSKGNEESAIGLIDRLLEYEPDAALAWYYRGRFQTLQGNHEEALASFENALSAELRRDVPDRGNLRVLRERVREAVIQE